MLDFEREANMISLNEAQIRPFLIQNLLESPVLTNTAWSPREFSAGKNELGDS